MFLFSEKLTVNSIVAGFIKTMSELEKLVARQHAYLDADNESIRRLADDIHARHIEISRAEVVMDNINNIINPETIEEVDPK